jgi:osmoprotectant transport system permease protein
MLFRVELPLALPAIIAGIRIATVTTIGLVTVTALIGQGGLGQLILRGLRTFFSTATLVGAILSVLLAVVADGLFLILQRGLIPWGRARSDRTR